MLATARLQFFTPAAVFLALSAVPVLLVQRSVNVARVAQGVPEQTRLGWPLRIVAAIGLAFLVIASIGELRSGNVDRMLGRSLEAGVAVGGKTPGWTVAPPTPGWVRLSAGRFGGEDSDLELGHPDGESWVVVYVTPRGSATLDTSVGMRIAAVRQAMGEITAREQRYFFPGLDLVAASHARYARAHGSGPVFHVLNVQATEAIEVIGFSASPALEGEIEASVRSLRIAPEEAKR
jgi:hypothetical protein